MENPYQEQNIKESTCEKEDCEFYEPDIFSCPESCRVWCKSHNLKAFTKRKSVDPYPDEMA